MLGREGKSVPYCTVPETILQPLHSQGIESNGAYSQCNKVPDSRFTLQYFAQIVRSARIVFNGACNQVKKPRIEDCILKTVKQLHVIAVILIVAPCMVD